MAAKTDYSFHGVPCDQVTFAAWIAVKKTGHCPWCGEAKSNKHGGMNRHLKTCMGWLKNPRRDIEVNNDGLPY